MQIFNSPDNLAAEFPNVVFAAGFFDGAHVGHQKIFEAARLWKNNASNAPAAFFVLTFDPHPLAILAPERKPSLIMSLETRLRHLAESGADGCLLLPFTKDLAELSAEDFVSQIFGGWFAPDKTIAIAAGANWRFGRGGAGDLAEAVRASSGKIEAVLVPSATSDGAAISSSAIRRLIASGDLVTAAKMLGRPYEICGATTVGRGIGAKLGFATANISHTAEILPPCGVYIAEAATLCAPSGCAEIKPIWRPAVANLGFRPTFTDATPSAPALEVHIIGHTGDLHGAEIAVRFISKLRDEMRFDNTDALVAQIRADIAAAESFFRYSQD